VQYLHNDQACSTRLITGSTGTVEGAYTYTPYGATESHTGTATTLLDYDGQLTSSDTGLIYLRARSYDPSTAQLGAEGISISAKIARQMEARGWTEEEIQEAIKSGEQVQAANKATGDPATRYINPRTGQSVVIDNGTKEVIHVGGPGFKYGPGSGDLP